MKNLLISGPPRCGKTTLIMKISQDFSSSPGVGGFLTEEVRQEGERIGFKIIALPHKKEGFLAKKNFSSPFRVGKYGVNVEDLERIGCSAIEESLNSGRLIVVDEIGKMELFSERFKAVLIKALDSPQKLLGTIMERRAAFTDRIKQREDVKLVPLLRWNFDNVFREIQDWLRKD